MGDDPWLEPLLALDRVLVTMADLTLANGETRADLEALVAQALDDACFLAGL